MTKAALRVLVMADVAADVIPMERALASVGLDAEVRRVETERALRSALGTWSPDLVLIDVRLPALSGHRALALIREITPDTPAIVVAETITEDAAVQYLRAGASDYVFKDRIERLGPSAVMALERVESRALERPLWSILDQSTNEVYVMDAESPRFLYANKGALDNLGYTRHEMLQLSPVDISAAVPDPDVLRSRMHPVISGEIDQLSYESAHRRKDGSEYPVELHIHRGELAGRPVLVGIVLDISVRVAHRQALEDALAEQQSLIEQLPAVTYTATPDEDCATLWISSQAGAAFGIPAEAFISDPGLLLKSVHPEDRKQSLETARRGRLSLHPTEMEFRIVRPDGSVRWFRDRFTVLTDRDGKPSVVRGVMLDITSLKETEHRQALLSAAVEQSANLIVITDSDGTIEYVNRAFEEATGYAADEVIGENPRILKSDEQPPGFYQEMWESLTAGQPWLADFTNRRKDGSLYKQRSTVFPIHDASGKTINFVSIGQDVTKELALESQLRQMQKVESIGLLAGGIAHDFNNLLTVIVTNTEFVRDQLPEDSRRLVRDLREIRTAARSGRDLVRKLMAFAREEELDMTVLDLRAVMREGVQILRRVLPENVVLRHEPSPTSLPVLLDESAVAQILMNLATNARDAMPGGGEIVVTERATSPGGETGLPSDAPSAAYALLTVRDTGMGMDASTRARVFDPFYTTKPRGKGTGLGMSQVFGLVERHNGHLTVESEPGMGTTVSVFFPLSDSQLSPVARPGGLTAYPRGTETILLVEDEPAIRRAAERILTALGYDVVTATDGVDALHALDADKDERFDLILSDLVMPKMGGAELFKTVRSRGDAPPFLFTSGYSEGVDVEGVDVGDLGAILKKPWEVADLARAVRQALDEGPAG